MLEIKSIDVAYGYLQILWDVSFKIDEGEVVAILGPNGAGKTTSLKTIAGLLKPLKGNIFFAGKEITGVPTYMLAEMGLAFIPEERNLFSAMTVLDNLILGAYSIKDSKRIKDNLEYVYSLFPRLEERKKQLAGTMSGGERQMLAIARGLMSNPKLLMLDEPSMGLSPQNVLLVFETIQKLRKEKVTVLIVEQNVNTTLKVADRAYVLEQGRIAMKGSSAELSNNDYVQKMYMGM